MRGRWLTLAVFSWSAGCATSEMWARSVEGAPVPDFSLREVDGENVTLSSLEHKVVFVLFTRAPLEGCPMGDLISWFDGFYRRQEQRGFEVLFVARNYARETLDVQQMKHRCNLAIKVLQDPDRTVTDRFFPLDPIGWYLIGRDQHLVRAGKNLFGRQDAQVLQSLLAAKP
jgi:peroxiredoxin